MHFLMKKAKVNFTYIYYLILEVLSVFFSWEEGTDSIDKDENFILQSHSGRLTKMLSLSSEDCCDNNSTLNFNNANHLG